MADSMDLKIYFHHGGKVTYLQKHSQYIGGRITSKCELDIDRFGFLDLVDEVKELGYISWDGLLFKDRNSGNYIIMKDDKEVMMKTSQLGDECHYCSVYVDNGVKDKQEGDGEYFDSSHDEMMKEILVELGDFGGENVQNGNESDTDNESVKSDHFSDTGDGLSDDELGSGDEEYKEARHNVRKAKKREKAENHEKAKEEGKAKEHDKAELEIDFPSNEVILFTPTGDEYHSDYADSNGEVNSDSSEEEGYLDIVPKKKLMKLTYDPKCNHKELRLELGMKFVDAAQVRDAIEKYALENGYPIYFYRSNKRQVEAKCREGCKWKCLTSLVKYENNFVIKTLISKHEGCSFTVDNNLATTKWIAKEYHETIRRRPRIMVEELQQEIMEKYGVSVSFWKIFRAKKKALRNLQGTYVEHYEKLRPYVLELMRVDREGKFELWCEGGVFSGFYVGFSALKKGFLRGCRRIIGLDGCFLKTPLKGVLLSAIGKDGNNQMFPIAWAVAEVENQRCWTWFLRILFEDLGINDVSGTTVISDQQKGLLNAVADLAPNIEHRNCARHVYCNWKKTHKGIGLKNIFWRAARSTYVEEYKLVLEDMKAEDEAAYLDFVEREPQRFCKAFISTDVKCDMIDNNISETFNGYILKARAMPIIDMMENMRGQLMTRQYYKVLVVTEKICPAIKKKIDKAKYDSRMCTCKAALYGEFEVCHCDDQFMVNLGRRTCNCRAWDISGIPCIYACRALTFARLDASAYVTDCYKIGKYKEAYKYGLKPVNGSKMWPAAEGNPILPPRARKMPGRPKTKRIRGVEEKDCQGRTKLPRYGLQMTCQNCYQTGHNRKTYKNKAVERSVDNGSKNTAARGKSVSQSSDVSKERKMARSGFGVLVGEETRNHYIRMTGNKVRPSGYGRGRPTRDRDRSAAASTSGVGGNAMGTQESRI